MWHHFLAALRSLLSLHHPSTPHWAISEQLLTSLSPATAFPHSLTPPPLSLPPSALLRAQAPCTLHHCCTAWSALHGTQLQCSVPQCSALLWAAHPSAYSFEQSAHCPAQCSALCPIAQSSKAQRRILQCCDVPRSALPKLAWRNNPAGLCWARHILVPPSSSCSRYFGQQPGPVPKVAPGLPGRLGE